MFFNGVRFTIALKDKTKNSRTQILLLSEQSDVEIIC